MNDCVQVVYCNAQSFQNMGSFTCLLQIILRPSGNNLFLELDVADKHILHGCGARYTVKQDNVIDAEV